MRTIVRVLLLAGLFITLFTARAQAQATGPGAHPQVYGRQLQDKLPTLKPHHTPLPRTAEGQVMLPKIAQEAIQKQSDRPVAPPVPDEAKQQLLQEQLRRVLQVTHKAPEG